MNPTDSVSGAKKEIVCKRENVASQQYFVNDGYGSHNFSGSKVIDADQWRRLMLEVSWYCCKVLDPTWRPRLGLCLLESR